MSRTILSAAAAAVLACGSVAVSAQTVTGEFRCGQDRYAASQGPFSWRVEFRKDGERITAQRPYIPADPRLRGEAIASFTGMMHSDGNVEMQIVGRGAQPPIVEGFHSAMSGRVKDKGFVITGPMLKPDGRSVRDCQVIVGR